MAKRKGQVVAATLVTPDTLVTFPIVDANDVGGGRHFYDTTAERNKIPPKHRKAGMIVYVGGAIKTDYILKPGFPTTGDTTDANWDIYAPGLPPGVLTEHQKLEDIQYRTPESDGTNTLMQKLAKMQADIDRRLTEHQKVEDIMYRDPNSTDPGFGGYGSLIQKLASLERAIATAGEDQHIDTPITWQNVPNRSYYNRLSHKADLAQELFQIYENLNNPNKMMLLESNGTYKDLQTKINELTTHVPVVEEIFNQAGTPLTTLLLEYKDPANINWDSTYNLRQKIDSLSSGLSSVAVETISWNNASVYASDSSIDSNIAENGPATTLEQNLVYIFKKLKIMNDDMEITVRDTVTAKPLRIRLQELANAINTAALPQHVEDIEWNTAAAGHDKNLAQNLREIWRTLEDMNDPDKIDIPNSVTGTTQKTLNQVLIELYNKFNNLYVEDINWKAPIAVGTFTVATSLKDNIDDIYQQLQNFTTRLNSFSQDIEHTNYTKTPSNVYNYASFTGVTRKSNLGDELDQLYTLMNKADGIEVPNMPGESLENIDLKKYIDALNTERQNNQTKIDSITNVQNQITSIIGGTYEPGYAAPQYMLFSVTELEEAGAFRSQEYLTAWNGKITEIVAYFPKGAETSVPGTITVGIEKCDPGSGAYSGLIASTSLPFEKVISSNTNAIYEQRADLDIDVAQNTRIRLNFSKIDSSANFPVFNVRVKVVATT